MLPWFCQLVRLDVARVTVLYQGYISAFIRFTVIHRPGSHLQPFILLLYNGSVHYSLITIKNALSFPAISSQCLRNKVYAQWQFMSVLQRSVRIKSNWSLLNDSLCQCCKDLLELSLTLPSESHFSSPPSSFLSLSRHKNPVMGFF